MCGIVGMLRLDGALLEHTHTVVCKMNEALLHRGPNGGGTFHDGPIALGHQRLAILDLTTAGLQPMTYGRYTITYNGEIYNHRDLRADFKRLRSPFVSRTDTEVVLNAFTEWGEKCVPLLDRTLFLARDRYGQKPLYYARVGEAFLFASEVKALVASGLLPGGVDREALLEYLTFQNTFGEQTLFPEVKLLPAGHTLTVRAVAVGQPVSVGQPERYWDFDFTADQTLTDEREVAEEVLRLLGQSVEHQLVADVAVGGYLSGGIDSGAIVSLATAARHTPTIRTFTCGFDLSSASGLEVAADERAQAELVSYDVYTEHYEVVLKAGDLERAMPELARAVEEPRVGQSYPNFYVAGLASKFNKVVLSGVGGDELFGGYPWRYERYRECWQERLMSPGDAGRLLAPLWHSLSPVRCSLPAPPVDLCRRAAAHPDPLAAALYFEAKTFLHGLLVVEDKLAMAHGLEVRFPFLDNDLVDFALRIPSAMKVCDGVGKHVLREAVRPILPAAIVDAPKRGFSAPDASWFRGPSLAYVWRELLGEDSRIRAYVDAAVLKEFLEQHVAGQMNRRLLIWSLLSVEYFLRTYG